MVIRPDAVETYSEWEEAGIYIRRSASMVQFIRSRNFRSRPDAVETYCEWEKTDIYTKING